MGQYYRQLIGDKNGKVIAVYNCCSLLPNGKKDFDGFKLMEHSWIENWFVNGICKRIYNNPLRIVWVGDYANEVGDFDLDIPSNPIIPDYYNAWGDEVFPSLIEVDDEFSIVGKFLLNHDTHEYIEITDNGYLYYSQPTDKSPIPWVIHPLPLLTAIGNGRGSGDFHEGNYGYENVGIWAWHLLEIADGAPMEYEELSTLGFVEER